MSKSPADIKWLIGLGKHILKEILKKGYKSQYEFWIEKAGDHISRSTLNALIKGTHDPKITTLKTLAKLLNTKVSKLLEFE